MFCPDNFLFWQRFGLLLLQVLVYILMEILRDSLVLTQFLVPNRKRYPITTKVFSKKCHTGLLWQWFQTTRKKYFILVMENHQDNFPFEIGGPGSNFAPSQSRGLLLLNSLWIQFRNLCWYTWNLWILYPSLEERICSFPLVCSNRTIFRHLRLTAS